MIKQDWMIIVAGEALVDELSAEQKRVVPFTGFGYDSTTLCAHQRDVAQRGVIGVEIVQSNYGYSVRYDSGLQNFGLVRSGKGVTLENAETFCREWVAADPAHRYAWRRAR
jgi:hypothetical protein